jgi:hypothetical protein
MSDYDPSLIFVVTYCQQTNVTYLKVLKIARKGDERGYSIYEDEDRQVLIDNLRDNLIAENVKEKLARYDNVKVTID